MQLVFMTRYLRQQNEIFGELIEKKKIASMRLTSRHEYRGGKILFKQVKSLRIFSQYFLNKIIWSGKYLLTIELKT